jgi:putative membrane protein
MWWHGGWGWWFITPLVAVAFWVAAIGLVVSLLRGRPGPTTTEPTRSASPEEALAQRYARGEIDDDEYHHRLDTLRGVNRAGGRP